MKNLKCLLFIVTILVVSIQGFSQTFTVGSHRDDVIKYQGNPDRIKYNTMGDEELVYGESNVTISKETSKVIGWDNWDDNLRVYLKPGVNITGLKFVSEGSPLDDVLKIYGTPDCVDQNTPRGLMYSFYPDSLLIIYISKTTNQVTEIFDLYSNKRIRHDERSKQIVAETLAQKSLKENFQVRTFNVKNKRYVISLDKVGAFIDEFPDAEEYVAFSIGKDTLNIPILALPDFISDNNASSTLFNYPEFNVKLIGSLVNLKKLYEYLKSKNPQLIEYGYDNFVSDLQNKKTLMEIYNGIMDSKFYIPYETFDLLLKLNIPDIDYRNISYADFARRIKQVYPEFGNVTDSLLAETFVKKYPIYKSRVTFSTSLYRSSTDSNVTVIPENEKTNNTLFYMDRVKIGQTEIGLPVPSEFVRIDGSHLEQLKTAELSVPETNSLLAYYLGEKDFADLIAAGSYKRDKYIMIEIFDELKYQNVKKITFRKYLKKFRNDYKFEFQESFNDRTIEAVNSIPESIIGDFKLNKMDSYPLGIYHDSNSAVSIGLLSKMDFSADGVSNQDILVASISTIINIEGKVLFLYMYKTYNHNSDLDWLKMTNESWINEIKEKQSPTNFFTEFDFMQFREVIMAILFLGFLWGGYIATKKIVKRTKADRANPPSPGLDENLEDENLLEPSNSISTDQENSQEFIDFDELLLSTDKDASRSVSINSHENQEEDDDEEVKSESSEENGYYIADKEKQWKVARTGLIIFGVLHFILEIVAESKLPILPVLINYYISAYYIKQQIKKNSLRSHPYMIAFSTSIVVFLVRVLFGLFLYLLGI